MKIEAHTRLAASTKICGCVTAACEHVTALTEKQKQLDIDGDGKIDGEDLKKVRDGETAEASVLEAATPKEAAQFVVKVFSKNGFNIKFAKGDSDDNLLVFNMAALKGNKFQFGLSLEGKTVTMDSLGTDLFDPSVFLSQAIESAPTTYLDFDKLGSKAFAKWQASTDQMAELVSDAVTQYKSFVKRFNAAIADITNEMAKAKK